MNLNWNFLWGEGVQNEKPSLGGVEEYGHFLELHVVTKRVKGFPVIHR